MNGDKKGDGRAPRPPRTALGRELDRVGPESRAHLVEPAVPRVRIPREIERAAQQRLSAMAVIIVELATLHRLPSDQVRAAALDLSKKASALLEATARAQAEASSQAVLPAAEAEAEVGT